MLGSEHVFSRARIIADSIDSKMNQPCPSVRTINEVVFNPNEKVCNFFLGGLIVKFDENGDNGLVAACSIDYPGVADGRIVKCGYFVGSSIA